MLVLVCGSRDWDDYEAVYERLAKFERGTTILHGAARGADQMADAVAWKLGFDVRSEPADWRGKGRAAGIIRNLKMLDMEPDLVIAFQKNGSRGTQHTIDEAINRKIPVEVHYPAG